MASTMAGIRKPRRGRWAISFLAQIKGMISDKKSFHRAEARQLLRFLENWFVGHISLEDQAYAAYVSTISDEDFQRFLDKRDPSLPL